MNTEIATIPSDSLETKLRWAQAMAGGSMLPTTFRGNPANLLFALEYADTLGIPRINAITSIYVVNGRPTASADLIASLVRKAGHKLRVSGDDTFAEATIIRADDPDFETTIRWDQAKAVKAGLWNKDGPWRNYPGAMMRARAITECARMAASDALYGVIYTPEELGETVDAEGNPVHNVTTMPRPRQATPTRTIETLDAETEPEPLPELDIESLTKTAKKSTSIEELRDMWKTTNGYPEDYVKPLVEAIMARQSALKKAQAESEGDQPSSEAAAVDTASEILNAEIVDINHLTEAPTGAAQ